MSLILYTRFLTVSSLFFLRFKTKALVVRDLLHYLYLSLGCEVENSTSTIWGETFCISLFRQYSDGTNTIEYATFRYETGFTFVLMKGVRIHETIML